MNVCTVIMTIVWPCYYFDHFKLVIQIPRYCMTVCNDCYVLNRFSENNNDYAAQNVEKNNSNTTKNHR